MRYGITTITNGYGFFSQAMEKEYFAERKLMSLQRKSSVEKAIPTDIAA